jgi:hypothetical protein
VKKEGYCILEEDYQKAPNGNLLRPFFGLL